MAPFLRNVSDDRTELLQTAVDAANTKPFFRAEPLTLDPSNWITEKRIFREHETKANELEGKGIVVIDLAYSKVEVTKSRTYLNRTLFETVRSAVQAAEVLEPRLCLGGLYLASLALSNTKWRGLVCIASAQMAVQTTQRILNQLAVTLNVDLSERRLVVLGTGVRQEPVRVIGDAAQAYADAFGGLLERLYAPHTENWFRIEDKWVRSEEGPPHQYKEEAESGYVMKFTEYLAGLWRLPLAEVHEWWGKLDWMNKFWFHESLKRVVGHVACADIRRNPSDPMRKPYYGPSVGTLAILTAACCPQSTSWLRGVRWANEEMCVPPPNGIVSDPGVSREVVQSFGAFAEDIFSSREAPRMTTIQSVEIADGRVIFEVKFPLQTAVRRDPPHSAGRLFASFEASLGRRLDVSGGRLAVGYP